MLPLCYVAYSYGASETSCSRSSVLEAVNIEVSSEPPRCISTPPHVCSCMTYRQSGQVSRTLKVSGAAMTRTAPLSGFSRCILAGTVPFS